MLKSKTVTLDQVKMGDYSDRGKRRRQAGDLPRRRHAGQLEVRHRPPGPRRPKQDAAPAPHPRRRRGHGHRARPRRDRRRRQDHQGRPRLGDVHHAQRPARDRQHGRHADRLLLHQVGKARKIRPRNTGTATEKSKKIQCSDSFPCFFRVNHPSQPRILSIRSTTSFIPARSARPTSAVIQPS